MSYKAFVSGANGHLGNNLLRILLANNIEATAGIRNMMQADPLEKLGSRPIHADLLDEKSLVVALQGQDVVFQVGAVFRHWSPKPKQDIYETNMIATRNIMQAAHVCGVKKVIYVSSLAAVDRLQRPITADGWNTERDNLYFRSKSEAEQLAWQLAEKYQIEMVSVLPGAMIGPDCMRLTPTMQLLKDIISGQLSVNPGFYFNFVDVRDVARATMVAADKGHTGERYLLANETCTSLDEMISIAQQLFPELSIKTPPKPPRAMLYLVALLLEGVSKLTGQEPILQRNYLKAFAIPENCDISKSRRDLDFNPRLPEAIITETYHLLNRLAN